MFADITTLACDGLAIRDVVASLAEIVEDASSLNGTLRGVWTVENGNLGEVVLVRTFDTLAEMYADHRAQYLRAAPFGVERGVLRYSMRGHEVFDFSDPLPSGEHGSIYEIRIYEIKSGALTRTLEGWRGALPDREPRSPLAVGMFSLDGRPSITHIWPFQDANQRLEVRRDLYAAELWPPKGGPESIYHGTSAIALPVPYSPWR